MAQVLVNRLNVRTAPNLHAPITGQLNKGYIIHSCDKLIFDTPFVWLRYYNSKGQKRYVCRSVGTGLIDFYVREPEGLPQEGEWND